MLIHLFSLSSSDQTPPFTQQGTPDSYYLCLHQVVKSPAVLICGVSAPGLDSYDPPLLFPWGEQLSNRGQRLCQAPHKL